MKRLVFPLVVLCLSTGPALAQAPDEPGAGGGSDPVVEEPGSGARRPATRPRPSPDPDERPRIGGDPGTAPPPPVGATPAPHLAPPPPGGTPVAAKKAFSRNKGFMLSLGFGGTGCTGDLCDTEWQEPMVYVRMQALFRVARYVALGLHTSFNFFYPKDVPSEVTVTIWEVMLAFEGRGIIPVGPVDIWFGIAFGYLGHTVKTEGSGGWEEIWYHGMGFGFGAGVNYFFNRVISLGLAFWLTKPWFGKGCYNASFVSEGDCGDVEDQDGFGITWSLGLNLTFFFGK